MKTIPISWLNSTRKVLEGIIKDKNKIIKEKNTEIKNLKEKNIMLKNRETQTFNYGYNQAIKDYNIFPKKKKKGEKLR